MYQCHKPGLYLFSILAMAFTQTAKADPTCPSDIIKPFVGQWQGKALFIPAQGTTQQQSRTKDEFAVIDCQSFEVTINYLDCAGTAVRILDFKAFPDKSGQVGLFAVSGTITEGLATSKMTGSLRQIQDGTLLGSFSGAIGGQPAYLNELMNLTALPNGESQLVRTIQMFTGKRGPYIGSRVVNESRIQRSS